MQARTEPGNLVLDHVPPCVSPSSAMASLRVLLPPLFLGLLTPVCPSFPSQQVSASEASSGSPGPPNGTCFALVVCKPRILLPAWTLLKPTPGEQAGRAVVYFFGLIYLFLGVSIISDRFMASIEIITSQVALIGPCVHGGLGGMALITWFWRD